MRMTWMRWAIGVGLAIAMAVPACAAVPFWGAKESSPAGTPSAALKPGQWIWGGDDKGMGPMVVVVSLTEQRAYVYRNGVLVALTTVSTGKPGHETPVGVFTILQKDKDHRSSTYNNAPMPYQQRLTWDGVALHAGGLPGYPESHGCIHLPSAFAEKLFGATNMGMTVVVAREGASHSSMVHPTMLAPVDAKGGTAFQTAPLAPGEHFRWNPEAAPAGPVSMILSLSDKRLVVLRNGTEIGRVRIELRNPQLASGTHAYVMRDDFMEGHFPQFPGGKAPKWMAVGVPGHEGSNGQMLDREAIDNVVVPREFAEKVMPLLVPGAVLVSTESRILPESTGRRQTIIDSNPPDAPAR